MIRFKGERGTVYDTLTASFGGLTRGLVTGTFDSELMQGRFTALPTRGDCITRPLAQARINLTATWKG